MSQIEFCAEVARNADGVAEGLSGRVREVACYEDGFKRDVLWGKGRRTGRTSDHFHPLLELHSVGCGWRKAEYNEVPGSLELHG